MRNLIIIALLLFTVSIAWAGKAILLVDQTSGDYYESVAEADIEAVWGAIEIYTSDDDYTDWVLQYMIADDSILKAFFADEDWGDMTVSGNTISLDTDSVGDNEIDYASVNMDDMTDGSTNAAITLTQETAYDAVVTADPSDYDEYSDLPIAVVSDGDTTHIPNCENVYEFCETTQDYLKTSEHVGANEAYGAGWDSDTSVPEKDDIYDYLHLIDTDDDGDVDNFDATAFAAAETDPNVDTEAEIEAITGALFGASKAVTSGNIWVADGGDFESVVMQGDVIIGADGTTTIQANAVDSDDYVDVSIDHEHLAPDIISGMTDVTSTDSDYILIWDATDSALKKVDMGEVRGGAGGSSEWTDQTTYLEPTDAGQSVRTKDEFQIEDANHKLHKLGTALQLLAAQGIYFSTAAANRFYWDINGNFIMGVDAVAGTSATNTLVIKAGTASTSSPADVVQVYAEDTVGAFGSEVKLVLHLNGTDGATSTTDSSPSAHTINFNETAQLDTAAKKWGTASLLLDGNSDYLDVADSTDWDVAGSNSDNWTIDFWVKHVDHVGAECYISQFESDINYWILNHGHDAGLYFIYRKDGSNIITVPATSAGEITDTNWHHIALVKVADEYGIYLDGTQVNYLQDSDTDTLSASLRIGTLITTWFDGQLDEIRIINSNIFSASPNATPNDTITVPTSEYSGVASAELKVRDEDTNVTTLSGNIERYPSDMETSEQYPYVSYKKQSAAGVETFIAECKMAELVQELAWEKGLLDKDKYIIKHVLVEPEKLKEGKKVSPWIREKIRNRPFEEAYRKYPKQDDWHGAKELWDESVKTDKDKEDIKTSLRNYKRFLVVNTPEQPVGAKVWFKIWKVWVDWEEPVIPIPPEPVTGNPTP